MRIIALDPGVSTGWAYGEVKDGKLEVTNHGWDHWDTFALKLHERMSEKHEWDVMVYETWRLTRRGADNLLGSDLQPSQAIGAYKMCAWLSSKSGHDVQIVGQEPAIKDVVDGWMGGTAYLPTSEVEHNRDALRHLWYYVLDPRNNTGVSVGAQHRPDTGA